MNLEKRGFKYVSSGYYIKKLKDGENVAAVLLWGKEARIQE